MRIIGFACRLPGADNVEGFWDVLREGRCTVSTIADDRFPTARFYHPDRSVRGHSVTFAAGVIEDIFAFDAGFFGISPREAAQMDPQQRLLLQVVWEAMESAGIVPSSLAGSEVGVFVGASSSDYIYRLVQDPGASDTQMMTGNTLSILANRISYQFDLRGPSFVVDTACSSSLVALSQACDALKAGRIETAIVAGVNILGAPYPFIGFSTAHMLSENGLCRAFDAAADGYVRSEGAVALVLQADKTTSAAPFGEIVGWGMNCDGRTNGLSLPSGDSQAELLRRIYRTHELSPDDLAFVEAHGTGTRVGDPAEAQAIGSVLGRSRRAKLPIGSVKSNVGHLEPAAGLVGLLKASLALRNQLLPASLHFQTANPDIRFDDLNLAVAAQPVDLSGGRANLAGVSSFGFGGANAHVVLRAPAGRRVASRPASSAPIVVSARSQSSLRRLASAYAEHLQQGAASLGAMANAAAYAREFHEFRAVVDVDTNDAAVGALSALCKGEEHPDVLTGQAHERESATLFVFSGNGSQWVGMGRREMDSDAHFREAIARVDALFEPSAGWSIRDALVAPDLEEKLKAAHFAQPLLFAIQVAIVEALGARGVTPDMVIGHSVGEVAAAWACGAISLQSAVRVIEARSRCQEVARGLGGMAALAASPDEIASTLNEGECRGVGIAAFNSANSVTIAGPYEQLDSFLRIARARRWPFRRLPIDYPYHNALLEKVKDPLLSDLRGLRSRDSRIPFFSTVSGALASGRTLGPAYWWANVREPVQFAKAMSAAIALKPRLSLEIGPAPVLNSYLAQLARDAGKPLAVLPTLQRWDENEAFANSVSGTPFKRIAARAFVNGARLDKPKFFGTRTRELVDLPRYAWDKSVFKVENTPEAYTDFDPQLHPLLGSPARKGDQTYFNGLDVDLFPWLADHKVGGAVVVPAAAMLEMTLAAARAALGDGPLELRDCAIQRPLSLEPGALKEVMVRVSPDEQLIDVLSRRRGAGADWLRHVRAHYGLAPAIEGMVTDVLPEVADSVVSREEFYQRASAMRLEYGPAFRTVERIDLFGDRSARVCFSVSVLPVSAFLADPTLVDGGLQGALCLLDGVRARDTAFLPTRFDRFRLYRPHTEITHCDVHIRRIGAGTVSADFVFRAADNEIVSTIQGGRSMAVRLSAAERPVEMYRLAPVRVGRDEAASAFASGRMECGAASVAESSGLIEAAALATAHIGLASFMGSRPLDLDLDIGSDGRGELRASLARILGRLETSGIATKTARGWNIGPAAKTHSVTQSLLHSQPACAVEATFLAAMSERLVQIAVAGPDTIFSPHLLDALLTRSQAAQGVANVLLREAGNLKRCWNAPGPLRILVVGAENLAFLRNLLHEIGPLAGSVCVADTEPSLLQAAHSRFNSEPGFSTLLIGVGDARRFDLAIAANPSFGRFTRGMLEGLLSERLAPNGRAVFAEWRGVFAELARLAAIWVGRDFSVDAPDWRTSLDELEVDESEVRLVSEGLEVSLTRARRIGAPPIGEFGAPRSPKVFLTAEGRESERVSNALREAIEAVSPSREIADETLVHVDLACCDETGPNALAWIADRCLRIREAILRGSNRRIAVVAPGALRSLHGCPGGRPEAYAVAGFLRVCANEYPDFSLQLIDFASEKLDTETLQQIAREIVAPSGELEVFIAGDERFGLRLLNAGVGADLSMAGDASITSRLLAPAQGSLERVVWTRAPRRPPVADEVEIEVKATGLNFRDVMWSLGALPPELLEDGFAGPTLGLECAGVITRVGPGVVDFAPGQSCVAFAPNSFSGHVTVPARAVSAAPVGMLPEAAATIPVCFVTVYYSLVQLAQLSPGETVLVHGGAGGVGLAALQIAHLRGARVLATSGHSDKRALLRDLGAEAVFDSRNLSFADQIMRHTKGEGVDVVLNSLAGDAMERSVRCLKPFGRFIELGKTDFVSNTRLGLRPFSHNLSYFGVDADQLLTGRPEIARKVFGEVTQLFAEGRLAALPYAVYDGEDIVDALRLMQRSHHVGKIVVRPPKRGVEERRTDLLRLRSDGTYIVIGGLGGFGLALVRRLAERGAGRIVLVGRKPPTAESAAALEQIRKLGAELDVRSLDAADPTSATELFEDLAKSGVLIRGIFHSAMVLDDCLIESLDADRLERVLRAKIAIAANLDRLSRDLRHLDHFVLFSSATTLVGNPGQANYVAGNAYLEELARRRRQDGLPALAVAWGPIGDVGYLTGNDTLAQIAARKLARHSLSVTSALDALEQTIACDDGRVETASVGLGRFDFDALQRELPLAATNLFAAVRKVTREEKAEAIESSDLAKELTTLTAAEARTRVELVLKTEVAHILKMTPSQIDSMKPLAELGVDSLMGVELRIAAEERLGVDIPLMSIGGAGSIADLAEKCLGQLRKAE